MMHFIQKTINKIEKSIKKRIPNAIQVPISKTKPKVRNRDWILNMLNWIKINLEQNVFPVD